MLKRRSIAVFVILLGLFACSPAQKTATTTPAQVMQAVQDQAYQFVATYIQPSGGRQRSITGTYTLNVSKTEVVADLPYIGRAYNAQIGSTDGGVKFQSKDFTYTSEAGKKDSKEITIKTNDTPDRAELFLTVYDNGSASLRVNSVNRQSISYTGEIRLLPQPK